MPEISIIIPIYNASKYIEECLESVLAQSIQVIEIICINDGSTDNSLEIIQEFQKKDEKIKIINQENQGVSAARNAGLKIAKGKYIGFVDSDDTISVDFYGKLYETAEKTNSSVVFSKVSENQDFSILEKSYEKEEIGKNLLPIFFKEDSCNSVWNKLYLNSIIQENQLQFPIRIKQGEDAQFNIEFLMHTKKVSVMDYCGYHYREVEGSATRNIEKHDYLKRSIEVYEYNWKSIIRNAIPENDLEKLKQIRFINSILSLVYIYGNRGNQLSETQRFSKLKEIINNPTVQKVFSNTELLEVLNLGRYSKAAFKMIKSQQVLPLYLLIQYSYYRNQ